MMADQPLTKFVLTVQVEAGQGDAVEKLLGPLADKLRGRLTRAEMVPAGADGYYYRQTRRTIRKLGH